MYISKAKHYAISRAIFNLEMAVEAGDKDKRWEMYDLLRELGIDAMAFNAGWTEFMRTSWMGTSTRLTGNVSRTSTLRRLGA